MKILVSSILFIVCILTVLLIVKRNNNFNKSVCGISGIMIGIFVYYSIIPFAIELFQNSISLKNKYMSYIINSNLSDIIVALIAVLLFIVSIQITYIQFNKSKIYKLYQFNEEKMIQIVKFFTYFTFIVGGISQLIYIYAFGGVTRLLSYSDYLRSFATTTEGLVSYEASILVVPAKLITVTPILIPLLYRKEKKGRYLVMFIIALILSGIYLFANAGKTPIIVFAMVFAVPFLQAKFKHPWIMTYLFCLIGFPMLDIMDNLFVIISGGQAKEYVFTGLLDYIYMFTHPWSNVLNLQEIVTIDKLRYGSEYITGIINILPGINFEPSYTWTSEFYGGYNWRSIGGTPNDVITFGYFQFGYLGIVLEGIFLGYLVGKIDSTMKQLPNTYVYNILKTSIIVNLFTLVNNACVSSIVQGQFQLIIVVFCMLYAGGKINLKVRV